MAYDDNEIRGLVLRELFLTYQREPHNYLSGEAILEAIEAEENAIVRNVRYLQGKGLVEVQWFLGGSFMARITSDGIDIYEQAKSAPAGGRMANAEAVIPTPLLPPPVEDFAKRDTFAKQLLDELNVCLAGGAFRAAHVIAWQFLMYSLYRKVEEYGLSTFLRLMADRKVPAKGDIRTVWDLNKIDDAQMVPLGHEIGVYDQNVRNQLVKDLETRNGFAHPSQLQAGSATIHGFLERVLSACGLVLTSKPSGRKLTLIDTVVAASDEERGRLASELDTQSIVGLAKQFFDEAALITNSTDLASRKPFFDFLAVAFGNRKNPAESISIFEVLHQEYFSGRLPYTVKARLFPVIMTASRSLEIKKHIFDHGYLDAYVQELTESGGYEDAWERAEVVSELRGKLTINQLEKICAGIVSNDQVSGSYKARAGLIRILRDRRNDIRPDTLDAALKGMGENKL